MNKLSIMTKGFIIAISMASLAYAGNGLPHSSLFNSWTGLYAGVDAGFIFNNAQLNSQQIGFTLPSETCNTNSNFSSFFPGVQLGYMYQFPNYIVSGIEANVTLNANQKNTSSCNSAFNSNVTDSFSFRNQMQTAIKGRVGRTLTWNKSILLPYLTAGASFANVGLTYQNEGSDYYSASTTQTGWLLGAGIEWAFMQNWSLRAEYYYVGYGNINLSIPSIYQLEDPNGSARVNLSSNNVAVAINYWF